MNMTLKRTDYRDDGIFGELYDDSGLFCYILEHAYDSGNGDGSYAPKIPAGTYTCKRRLSPRFGYEVFEVLDVPNCSFIEIHRGNYQRDSEGCILLGTGINKDEAWMLTSSAPMFNKFMQLQANNDTFTLVVEG